MQPEGHCLAHSSAVKTTPVALHTVWGIMHLERSPIQGGLLTLGFRFVRSELSPCRAIPIEQRASKAIIRFIISPFI